MVKKTTVAILFGGVSSEHEVSLVSAFSALENIDRSKYDVIPVGITKDGVWMIHNGSNEAVKDGSWVKDAKTRVLVDPSRPGGLIADGKPLGVDVVFPVLHGANGEDGTLQGMLELAGVPVVGCGSTSSGVSMDKTFTKRVLIAEGIRQAPAAIVTVFDYESDPDKWLDAAENAAGGYPVFVKPASAGSSVGCTKAKDREELKEAFAKAFACDYKLLAEKNIIGREIETAVLGAPDGSITVSECGEIDPGSEFYDYDTKYKSDTASYYIPARLTPETAAEVRATAAEVFRALDCRGLSRVDFFVTDDNEVIFNEINTLPGFTPISMYPKLMANSGLSFPALIDALIEEALNRKA